MPEFRSADDRSSDAGFIFRSELPVASRRAMLPFMRGAIRIKRSLDAAQANDDGILHYRLEADVRATTFRVESAWRDEASFRAWVDSEPHRSVMASLGRRVSGGTFDTEVVERA